MSLKITLDLYSGRPNPTIILKGRNAQAALARLRPARALDRDEVKARPLPTSTLGYRGIVVEQLEPLSAELPQRFRYAGGDLFDGLGPSRATDESFEDYVFGPGTGSLIGRFAPETLPRDLAKEVGRFDKVRDSFSTRKILFPIELGCPCAPLYEPAWWNDGGQRQFNNNCYNYGCNYRTDTFAQPGLANGAMYPSPIDAVGVHNGAIADALTDAPKNGNKCPKEGHVVALVIAPGFDFHWYRRGRNSLWTHKPGGTPVTNLDNSGNLISDPKTADRGPYTVFAGYMIVMHGHIKIQ